ncbi:abortive infection protein [Anaeromyces robustus]|uniref:Abortive infection protein n=1 Tax=Anaeromyces robustus TaxID=1754192 RepID=A0A1Y1WTR5_9FUNG|nr:abortive infection protein [Anaeromyces robustus]|eukprot:ORX76534.1 abortive infection protein [Anaeromyces robustus]
MILSITVLGPILEEFVFRKLLFGIINNYSKILAYLVSCILFGLSHLDFKNLLSYNEYISLPIYIVSGFILAFAYDFDGCLLASIIAHALNNGFDTICFFINNY